MTSRVQTILGANGVIGRELSPRVRSYGHRVRQVARTPYRVHSTDDLVSADLLDARATAAAVAGSDVTYLVAGLKYDHKVWQAQWPVVMRNAIDACMRHGSALVFVDNVYAYGRVDGAMTENTPYNPCSRKGEVRARIATMFMDTVKRGDLRGMIVRSADFYGPGAELSVTHATVTARLRAGRTPQWMGNPKALHSFTYTPDAGRTLALLANTPAAYGQVWHALVAGRPYRLRVAPRWLLSMAGLFVPLLRENMEMLYQFEHDYHFDSRKVERAYGLTATRYRDGITATWRDSPSPADARPGVDQP